MIIKIMEGERAPNFLLYGYDDKQYSLESFDGMGIVLFFYNKDNTPDCSKEADDFSNHLDDFHQLGYEVVGVSPDNADSHKKFVNKKKLKLILLSDRNYAVATAYGSYGKKKMFQSPSSGIIRSTFVIDKNRDVLMAHYNVDVTNHVEDTLKFIAQADNTDNKQ